MRKRAEGGQSATANTSHVALRATLDEANTVITMPSLPRPVRIIAGLATAAAILLATVPAASADEPADYVTDFAIVSTSLDAATGLPTVAYTFRCLQQVDLVRIRSSVAQRHGVIDAFASSFQTSAMVDCQPGQTVTLSVVYGPQQGTFHPGHADLVANLDADEEAFTVDGASITRDVLLRPAHRR